MSDPSGAHGEPYEFASRDLVDIAGRLREAIDRQLRESGGLSYLQFRMLAHLAKAPTGSARMTELADGVVHSRSGLTYQAGLLEAAGLVTRTPSPDDDRGVTVTITDSGRRVEAIAHPGHHEVAATLLFGALDLDEVAELAGLLAKVRDHLNASPRRLPRRTAAPGSGAATVD